MSVDGRGTPALPRCIPDESHGDDCDTQTRGMHEQAQIVGIRSDDLVAVRAQSHQSGIDCIAQAAARQQKSSTSSKCFIERNCDNGSERPGQIGLTRFAPPNLRDDTTMRHGRAVGVWVTLDTTPQRTVVSLEGDEGASVKDKRHSAAFNRALTRARTAAAARRSSRRCSAISSSVISPYSAS